MVANKKYAFELWNKNGSKMYTKGPAVSLSHASELIQIAMQYFKDQDSEGHILENDEVVSIHKYKDLFVSQ